MLQDSGSHSFKIARSSASGNDLADRTDSRTLLSRDYVEFRPPAEQKEPVARALSREIAEHKRQVDSQSYLDRGISFLGDSFSGSSESLKKLEALQTEAAKGEPNQAREKEMLHAIADDQTALETDAEITKYGSGMVQTAGLFISGKKGLALTAVSFAAASAKPADPLSTRALDMTLGVTKGLVTRGVFGTIAKSGLDIPSKALVMGGSSRLTDSLFTRQTYLNPADGTVDLTGAAGRIVKNTAKPEAVAADLLVFGGGQLAMSSPMVRQFAERSPLRATIASAAAFGFAGGGAEEASRQIAAGQFDINKIVARGIARGATDMVAAVPGGVQGNRLAARQSRIPADDLSLRPDYNPALSAEPKNLAGVLTAEQVASAKAGSGAELSRPATLKSGSDPGAEPMPSASRETVERFAALQTKINFGRIETVHSSIPGSQSREFKIVGGDERGLDLLRGSPGASAVVAVREVSPSGAEIGPTKKMLVQHHDADTPINSRLAATCDLIASCNPNTLFGSMRAKHILPDVSGSIYLNRLSDRLTFGASDLKAATAGGAIRLGNMTVSDLLRLPTTDNKLRTPRPLELYAREMAHFKDPAKRVITGGADSIVFELADGRILKMTDRPYREDGQPLWRPEWGHRTILTPEGVPYKFDAMLLTEPRQIEVNHEPVLYYIQERAQTPVSTPSLVDFHNKIQHDGKYVFWDGGVSSLGQAQLGYVRGSDGMNRLVLLDYDAVSKPGEVPKFAQKRGGTGTPFMSRYLESRVDWD